MNRSLLLAVLVCLSASPHALTSQATTSDLVVAVDRFIALDRARQAPGATAADVDRVLALLTDSVIYEHPRAGARLQGKSTLRQGMLGYLGSVRNGRDSVLQRTSAPGVVVVVTQTRGEIENNGKWDPFARRTLRVIEFEGDRIRRIIEYGW